MKKKFNIKIEGEVEVPESTSRYSETSVRKCQFCGKEFKARGLHAHIRQAHPEYSSSQQSSHHSEQDSDYSELKPETGNESKPEVTEREPPKRLKDGRLYCDNLSQLIGYEGIKVSVGDEKAKYYFLGYFANPKALKRWLMRNGRIHSKEVVKWTTIDVDNGGFYLFEHLK